MLQVDGLNPEPEKIKEAADVLRQGGTVAFPTETVYGLGANACDTLAVEAIFEAKGRPSDNPLIVHISDLAQLDAFAPAYGESEKLLMERFWPGPLTLVLPLLAGTLSDRVTAGLDTVAVRMPSHPVALALIAAAGCPIAAPSANSSGRPSPTEAAHVLDDLDGRIDAVADGGPSGVGLESTVIEVEAAGTVRILRPGGITAESMREAGLQVEYDQAAAPQQSGWDAGAERFSRGTEGTGPDKPGSGWAPRSPGMKYAHYAPRGTMQLVEGEIDNIVSFVNDQVKDAQARGECTGVLAFHEHAAGFEADHVLVIGSLAHLEQAAQGLYAALRAFDSLGVDRIWAQTCPEAGIGHALMNRLAKAAAHRIIRL
ncbi:threonylcarbamoyl-AMP synthase [Paenibacillus nasutitermitis]|uniref:Threonylcarbamoyl-AMP synthase n=1 Tax=Paenibacillus nasutitermitis TaxID=1652958 RepID=A0A916ZF05_9BACL|nr:threonylcarbamoyl-AMP synthase [Paenibacillus nasutitermitis]